jgi:hypothetical protein
MPMLTYLVLLTMLVATSPDAPEGGDPSLTQAQAFTMVANVLGAATACDGIPHDRVSAAARQVGTLATAHAISIEDTAAAERLLMVSAVAGREAVEKGLTDCTTVASAFGEIEQMVLQTPVVQRRQGPARLQQRAITASVPSMRGP